MPSLKLAFTLAATAYASGQYFLNEEDDDFPPLSPSRDSYHPRFSYNSGTARTQTQQSYRPPPPSRTQPSRLYSSFFHTNHVQKSPEYKDEDVYEDGYGHGYQDEDDYEYRDEEYYVYRDEDDCEYQDEDEDEYRYEDGYGCEDDDDEDQNGDEYEYFQTISRVPSRVYTEGKPHLLTAPIGGVSSHPRSDEPAGIEDLTFAKKLRKQARRKGREMSEAYRRAESARRKGDFRAARAHAQDAIAHEREMRELDKRAAKIFFRENNKNHRDGGEIDLHGLYVAEAIQVAEVRVRTARWRGDGVVSFVVGKGLHSDAGEAKIRPALEDLFTERGLEHFLDPYNTGVLVVLLD